MQIIYIIFIVLVINCFFYHAKTEKTNTYQNHKPFHKLINNTKIKLGTKYETTNTVPMKELPRTNSTNDDKVQIIKAASRSNLNKNFPKNRPKINTVAVKMITPEM